MPQFLQDLLENVVVVMVALPVFGAVFCLLVSRFGEDAVRRVALTNVLLTFSLSVLMAANYDSHRRTESGEPDDIQMQRSFRWLAETRQTPVRQADENGGTRIVLKTETIGPDVRVSLGVDGISLWLIVLTATLMIPVVSAEHRHGLPHPGVFYSLLLLLQAGSMGTFAAQDVILFCCCGEFTLLSAFFLIGRWGGPNRTSIARRFLLVNLTGSLLIVLGLVAVVWSHSWMRADFSDGGRGLTYSTEELLHGTKTIPTMILHSEAAAGYWNENGYWIFLALLAGFSVRLGLFPFHTWLPAASRATPTGVSILLTAVMVKFGCYGFLRFVLPLFPQYCLSAAGWIVPWAVVGVVYAAVRAVTAESLKSVVILAGISQMALSAAGVFSLTAAGINGSLLNLFGHGLSIALVLFVFGLFENRRQSVGDGLGIGSADRFPKPAIVLLFGLCALGGLPGLSGFSGQLPLLAGIFQRTPTGGFWCLVGALLIVWSFVRFYCFPSSGLGTGDETRSRASGKCVPKPELGNEGEENTRLSHRELAAVGIVGLLIVWIGLSPQFFLERMRPSVSRILNTSITSPRDSIGDSRQ